ncbi:MAG: hypothetical protein IT436_03455 [Phycisphaerales bacterium]|nr:hypothetical protein [Phycisphaerales bacterium]
MSVAAQGVLHTGQAGAQTHHHMARATQLSLAVDEAQTQLKSWGAGLNTFNRQWEDYRTAFVENSLKPGPVAPGTADSTRLHVTLCTSEEDLASEICSSFEAGAAYSGVEVKGSASFLFESKMSDTSSVVVAQVSVCKVKQQLDRGSLALTDSARDLMKKDPVEFVRRYGNYFHMGRLVGGKLTILMHFTSTDLSSKASFDSDLKATFSGVGDAGARIKAAVNRQSKHTSLDVSIYHVGGGPPPATASGSGSDVDPDTLVRYAVGFESTVDDARSMPFEVLYDDYGSIGDAGPDFRDALAPAEVTLDNLTDALQAYREPLSASSYALDHETEIGLGPAEIATLKSLHEGVVGDIETVQDHLRMTSDLRKLQTIDELVKSGEVRQPPSAYATLIAAIDLNPRVRGVNYGEPVWLNLKSQGKYISAAEYGGALDGNYYGKLGANQIKVRFVMSASKKGKVEHGDQIFIETTERFETGISKRMRDIGGAYGDYVGWRNDAADAVDLRFTIVKCHPTTDPVIQYGEPVWIMNEDSKWHLEQSGPSYPDHLGLREIVGKPGQVWIIEKPRD